MYNDKKIEKIIPSVFEEKSAWKHTYGYGWELFHGNLLVRIYLRIWYIWIYFGLFDGDLLRNMCTYEFIRYLNICEFTWKLFDGNLLGDICTWGFTYNLDICGFSWNYLNFDGNLLMDRLTRKFTLKFNIYNFTWGLVYGNLLGDINICGITWSLETQINIY